MRRFMIAVLCVASICGLVACSPSDVGSRKTILKSEVASSTPIPTMDMSTPEPAGNIIWSLTTGRYYAVGNKLYELACTVKHNKLYNGKRSIGAIKGKVASITYNDTSLGRRVVVNWKINGATWSLAKKDATFNRYGSFLLKDGYLYNTSSWYEITKTGKVEYHTVYSNTIDVGFTASKDSDGIWSFTETANSNLIAKKDAKGKVYYEQGLVHSEE